MIVDAMVSKKRCKSTHTRVHKSIDSVGVPIVYRKYKKEADAGSSPVSASIYPMEWVF